MVSSALDFLSFSNDFDPDLKVNPVSGKSFYVSANQENEVKKIDGIVSYSKVIEERVLFYFDGKELDSCVLIRFVEKINNNYFYKSGGGITTNSIPEKEYQELIDKIYVPSI